jgi:long-chain acyl-CoA synthetase
MTETGGFATVLRWRDHLASGPNASGCAPPASRRSATSEDRAARRQRGAADTLGEICVRSSMLMNGYFNNPQATAAVLKDGWMHTGEPARSTRTASSTSPTA